MQVKHFVSIRAEQPAWLLLMLLSFSINTNYGVTTKAAQINK